MFQLRRNTLKYEMIRLQLSKYQIINYEKISCFNKVSRSKYEVYGTIQAHLRHCTLLDVLWIAQALKQTIAISVESFSSVVFSRIKIITDSILVLNMSRVPKKSCWNLLQVQLWTTKERHCLCQARMTTWTCAETYPAIWKWSREHGDILPRCPYSERWNKILAIVLEATTKKIPKQTNKQDSVHYCASAEGIKVAGKSFKRISWSFFSERDWSWADRAEKILLKAQWDSYAWVQMGLCMDKMFGQWEFMRARPTQPPVALHRLTAFILLLL